MGGEWATSHRMDRVGWVGGHESPNGVRWGHESSTGKRSRSPGRNLGQRPGQGHAQEESMEFAKIVANMTMSMCNETVMILSSHNEEQSK